MAVSVSLLACARHPRLITFMSVRSLLSLSLLTPYPAERSGGSPFGAEGREEDDRAERGPTRPRVRVTNGRKE